jgi:hypothetical protein
VVLERQSESYYAIVREFETMLNPKAPRAELEKMYRRYGYETVSYLQSKHFGAYYQGKGRDVVKKEYHVTARPLDKREFYVKRAIGLPCEKFEIIDTQVYIDDAPMTNP